MILFLSLSLSLSLSLCLSVLSVTTKVDLLTGFFTFTAPLAPLLRIPKDYCLCSDADCPTTAATESPTAASSNNSKFIFPT